MTKFIQEEELFLYLRRKKCALMADENVASLHSERFLSKLPLAELFTFPPGEKSKTRETKAILEDKLLSRKMSSDTPIIALGGGVTTDLVGFLASTFCRGSLLTLIPTSLLAMVDACFGDKNGVNTPEMKNAIGTYYSPEFILLNPLFLETLPEKEWLEGNVEAMKHGLLADPELFTLIAKDKWALRDDSLLLKALQIKMSIIERDKHDPGARSLLNLGHTVGHAIESYTEYKVSHGSAVALGIVAESFIAYRLGILSEKALLTIKEAFSFLGAWDYEEKKLIEFMKLDKKSKQGIPHFVFLEEIGASYQKEGSYCHFVEKAFLEDSLRALPDLFQ